MNSDILALAFEGHVIRTTQEDPKRISVLDVLAAVGYSKPKDAWARIKENHFDVVHSSGPHQFVGQGQRPTPVIDKQGVLRLVMVLEGPTAARFREWASSILVRYLEGDRTLAQEIHLRADVLEGERPVPSLESLRELALDKLQEALAEKKAWAVKLALSLKGAKGVPSLQIPRIDLTDTISDFIEECCVKGPHLETPSRLLYLAYVGFCNARQVSPVTETAFGRQLSLSYTSHKKNIGHFRRGLALKPN